MERDYLRGSEVGILHEVIVDGKILKAYKSIDGKWITYDPMKEDHEKIIKPDEINGKIGVPVRDLYTLGFRKKEEGPVH